MRKLLVLLTILSVVALAPTLVQAQNLLTNGDLNSTTPGDWVDLPTGWTLYTDPTMQDPMNAPARYPAFQATYSDRTQGGVSGRNGLVFNSTEGDFPGYPDVIFVDADLTQTVAATPGQTYRMSGFAYFEGGYAGGVDTIATGTGTTREGQPSLTETYFALEFLDAGNMVLPGSVVIELHDDGGQVNNPDPTEQTRNWMYHKLVGTAPAGAVSVRVRASMVDGEFNIDMPHQAAWIDDFSLVAVPEPATGLLALLSFALVGGFRRTR